MKLITKKEKKELKIERESLENKLLTKEIDIVKNEINKIKVECQSKL